MGKLGIHSLNLRLALGIVAVLLLFAFFVNAGAFTAMSGLFLAFTCLAIVGLFFQKDWKHDGPVVCRLPWSPVKNTIFLFVILLSSAAICLLFFER